MTPAVLSALPMHPALLAPALAGLPAAFTPSTTAVGGNVYLTAAVGLLGPVAAALVHVVSESAFILNSARLVPRRRRRR